MHYIIIPGLALPKLKRQYSVLTKVFIDSGNQRCFAGPMQIKAKEIKMVRIDELKLDPDNRNLHSEEQIQELMNIIRYQGFREPVTVSLLSGVVKAGNARVIAAQRLGMVEVPVIYQEFDDKAQEYAHGIATNAIAKWAKFDLTAIAAELPTEFPNLDVSFLGLPDFKLDLPVVLPGAPPEAAVPADVPAQDGIFKMILHYEAAQYEPLMDQLAALSHVRAFPNISQLFAELVKEALDRELPRTEAQPGT